MENDYYSSNENSNASQDPDSQDYGGNYYEVKEKPSRIEFYKAPEQKDMRIMLIILGILTIVFCVIDYFRLDYIYDHTEGENLDTYYNIVVTLLGVIALMEVTVFIWGNELTTILGCLASITTVYLCLHYFNGLTFFPIGVLPMVCVALQFNQAQNITGKYKRKYSAG